MWMREMKNETCKALCLTSKKNIAQYFEEYGRSSISMDECHRTMSNTWAFRGSKTKCSCANIVCCHNDGMQMVEVSRNFTPWSTAFTSAPSVFWRLDQRNLRGNNGFTRPEVCLLKFVRPPPKHAVRAFEAIIARLKQKIWKCCHHSSNFIFVKRAAPNDMLAVVHDKCHLFWW